MRAIAAASCSAWRRATLPNNAFRNVRRSGRGTAHASSATHSNWSNAHLAVFCDCFDSDSLRLLRVGRAAATTAHVQYVLYNRRLALTFACRVHKHTVTGSFSCALWRSLNLNLKPRRGLRERRHDTARHEREPEHTSDSGGEQCTSERRQHCGARAAVVPSWGVPVPRRRLTGA